MSESPPGNLEDPPVPDLGVRPGFNLTGMEPGIRVLDDSQEAGRQGSQDYVTFLPCFSPGNVDMGE